MVTNKYSQSVSMAEDRVTIEVGPLDIRTHEDLRLLYAVIESKLDYYTTHPVHN